MAICKWCGKEIENHKIGGHTTFCVKNPNRELNLKLSRLNINKMTQARQTQRQENPNEHTRREFKTICERCGKEFIQITSEYNIRTGKASRFCSRKCANSHPKACKGKTKIVKCIDCGVDVEVKIQSDPKKIRCVDCKKIYKYNKHQIKICAKKDDIKNTSSNKTFKSKVCEICGGNIEPTLTPSGNYSKTKYCSNECKRKAFIKIGHDSYESSKRKGLHKPWQSRNITSYPEKFWISVLKNNNIPFTREYHLDNKYFLDFYLETNDRRIDLEIDGSQHKREDHIKHDQIRDEYMSSIGIEVYRIPWNCINTEHGKNLMKDKIEKFLSFYNNSRI